MSDRCVARSLDKLGMTIRLFCCSSEAMTRLSVNGYPKPHTNKTAKTLFSGLPLHPPCRLDGMAQRTHPV